MNNLFREKRELRRKAAAFESSTDRNFLKQVSKEKIEGPGPGEYIDDQQVAQQ